MSLKKKPVTGMKDILPDEMKIRDYVIRTIKDTYSSFGFSSIETPCVEHIENLSSKQGGENEKLIFKILKRGEKLNLETAETEADLVDSGLRYDLTVPLSRYFSNNANSLPVPFKALQMGNVWRADRPQRGRFRQFMQCDIDILGDSSCMAEIDLILAMSTLLNRLEFTGYVIRINDRKLLKAMAAYSGFEEKDYDTVFIILDKMDKIGLDGVKQELLDNGFAPEGVDKYLDLFEQITRDKEGVRKCASLLGSYIDSEVVDSLLSIIESVEAAAVGDFRMEFDPTLVRGMSYYTGPIFEIAMEEYGGSVGGGGRYDEMIGRFTGKDTCAVGFSVGFERIVMLLMEKGFKVPEEDERIAFLVEKGMPGDRLSDILKEAAEARKSGKAVSVVQMQKNKKFQKQQLSDQGFSDFKEYFV